MNKRKEMAEGIKRDYPKIPQYMINWMLDLYEKNPDYFKDLQKNSEKKQRKKKTPSVPVEIIQLEYNNVEIIDRDKIPKDPQKMHVLQEPTILDFEKITL